MPGVHHVEARVFKDVFPRFKTMQGRHVVRKAGWDCHGLPVEIAIEKELGFTGKGDIEAYGVAEFNARCRESVLRHVGEFEAMTERMGYWVDMSDPYRTMDPEYVQSVWWSLKTIFDKGLLVQDHRVAPYCPRCGTGLSDHELAQGYETVVDPSVYVRFPLTSGPYAGSAALLVWTTTPWTLVSNTAVAVRPDVTYVVATDGTETLVLAEPLLAEVLGDGWSVTAPFAGAEMERWTYQRPFELVDWPESADGSANGHYVVLADYVTTDDGTGLVHQAPAFGAEDLAVSRGYGLPVVRPVQPDGHFEESSGWSAASSSSMPTRSWCATSRSAACCSGTSPTSTRTRTAGAATPRCSTTPSRPGTSGRPRSRTPCWPRTSAPPGSPRPSSGAGTATGCNNNIDWALSRSRFWGTPLPVWRCAEDPEHLVCVGSLAELGELAGEDLSALDPHRPYVDDVTLPCPECSATMRRVPEVIDAWYDSGSMPFAQWGYPHAAGSVEKFTAAFPAQFICEAIDQTRGWFYTLMAVSTMVHGRSSYENVLCLGHIVAEDGRKMSKHLGNVLQPMPLMEQHGADALRWFMAASGSPWLQRRVGHTVLQEVVRKTLLTYWNTASFLTLYAGANDWSPLEVPAPEVADRPLLDRWLLSETHRLVQDVTAAYEAFDTQRVGRLLADHVDDVQLVRAPVPATVLGRRPGGARDPARVPVRRHAAARPAGALRHRADLAGRRAAGLAGGARLGAPGGLAEGGRRAGRRGASPSRCPGTPGGRARPVGPHRVEGARPPAAGSRAGRRPRLGRAARGAATAGGRRAQRAGFEELAGDLVDRSAKGNFRALGKRFGKQTPVVAAAVAAADARALAEALRDTGHATVVVDGAEVEVSPRRCC